MIEMIKKNVEEKLKSHPNRLLHVFGGVYETAVKLARHYHLDEDKISIAALFHDYTKYDDLSDQIKWLTKEEIVKYKKISCHVSRFKCSFFVRRNTSCS